MQNILKTISCNHNVGSSTGDWCYDLETECIVK